MHTWQQRIRGLGLGVLGSWGCAVYRFLGPRQHQKSIEIFEQAGAQGFEGLGLRV